MCGIGGLSRHPGIDLDIAGTLDRMLGIQSHRGPDARGKWLDESGDTGLCHNRLAILDLSDAGNQPMHSADGRFAVVFNGEIYNFRELRDELIAAGQVFRSHADTEVLLAGYHQWGEGMLQRLRGMFAFALYDRQARTLFCARDRVGKKPFVYAETPAGFAFASEISALKKIPGIDLGLDHAALAAMLLHNLRHIPDPNTAYRGIRRLRPGHAIVVRAGRIERIWRYWQPRPADGPVTAARLRELIEESVRLRMVADVPVGALLSGGVDSSAIVALMTRFAGQPVRTYALGMDAGDEDLRRARQMAGQLGCVHTEFHFDAARQWEIFGRLIETHGEPIMLLPLIHAFELSDAIRADGVKVVLGGHGADELFYGYTGHVRTARLSAVMSLAGPLVRVLAGSSARRLPPALAMLASRPGERKAAYYRQREATDWAGVLAPAACAGLANAAADEFAYWGRLCPSRRFIDESNFVALMVENAHSVTISADLPPMLASVEMRAPFLDQEIVEFALATPVDRKVPWLRPHRRLKWILRQAVSDLVPHDLLFAPKRGFGSGIPQDTVLREHWGKHGDALFADPDDAEGLFDRAALRSAWAEFRERGSSGSNRVANLFAIQYWLQNER